MATLSGYITEVRRLLHDANGNFYSDSELTDYINEARKQTVRDTGCLRKIQISQTPMSPVAGGANPVAWTAGATVATNDYVFSNIFIYKVTVGGVLGTDSPPYPSSNNVYPPSAPFTDGTATLQYAGNCEKLPFAAFPESINTVDIVNINLYWGNSRVPLQYLPWTQFNAQLRYWQNYIGRPVAFSVYGQQTVFISPVPDQVYSIEMDTVVLPEDLVLGSEVDVLIEPYVSAVPYFAAHKAKFKEQSYGEAEIYKQNYIQEVRNVLTTTMTRRIPNPYSTPF
jgi:hypothetical protein